MSQIVNDTVPFFSIENESGGLDIQGFEDQENRLNGTDGSDFISGGDLNDLIFGGGGADILSGGEGSDTFLFSTDNTGSGDIPFIEDFVVGEDSLGILGLNQGDNIDYNRDTGIISVNGEAVVRVGRELSFGDGDLDVDSLLFEESDLSEDVLDTDVGTATDGEDVFAFSSDLLDSDVVVPIEGFVPGEDTIQLEGISSGDNIDIDTSTGILSINGEPFAQIEPGINVDDSDFDLM